MDLYVFINFENHAPHVLWIMCLFTLITRRNHANKANLGVWTMQKLRMFEPWFYNGKHTGPGRFWLVRLWKQCIGWSFSSITDDASYGTID